MAKIPYERIAPEANRLYEKMVVARDIQELKFWYDAYVSVLQAAGWDPVSFDKETQRRVDEGWDEGKPPIWN
jgi:hypothetical protein